MRFEVGDVVRIAKTACEISNPIDKYNPRNINGIIVRFQWNDNPEFPIIVEWDNGRDNGFRESELRLVRRQ